MRRQQFIASASHALDAGDVAIISFASDNPDAVSFVVLQEVPASTAIRFTDSGWFASGGFRANEGGIQYTAPSTLTPGTVSVDLDPGVIRVHAISRAGAEALEEGEMDRRVSQIEGE